MVCSTGRRHHEWAYPDEVGLAVVWFTTRGPESAGRGAALSSSAAGQPFFFFFFFFLKKKKQSAFPRKAAEACSAGVASWCAGIDLLRGSAEGRPPIGGEFPELVLLMAREARCGFALE